MIPLAMPNLCGREGAYLQECITSGFVSSVGPFVSRFEEMVASVTGAAGSVATSSGTTALHLALVCAGVRRDDLVITPSFSFIATANAISHCAADPWLFDISPENWCLDIGQVRKALRSETERLRGALHHRVTGRRIGALLPVYTLGVIPDMEAWRELATEFGLPLVADGACALGATQQGRGAAAQADLTMFSFNGNKTVTCGGGGAIAGIVPEWLARAKHLCSTARVGADYHHDAVGYNYRMTNLAAAVGCAQLENFGRFLETKHRVREHYRKAFEGWSNVGFFPEPTRGVSACWFSGIVLQGATAPAFASVAAWLNGHGVLCRPFWKPIHLQPPYASCLRARMEVCEGMRQRIVVLPSSTQITSEQLARVVEECETAMRRMNR